MTANRPRACVAILRNKDILMIRHVDGGRDYWTLPGGGVEAGETIEQAAMRETQEECGLGVKITRFLYERPYVYGIEYCFQAEIIGSDTPIAGNDPEYDVNEQIIREAGWQPLERMENDRQVRLVLQALNLVKCEKNSPPQAPLAAPIDD